ncbi:hypothetical protein MRB53_040989 [Persea americana]|nr:hypothetical protein MRB53_040989 [Persea americana]
MRTNSKCEGSQAANMNHPVTYSQRRCQIGLQTGRHYCIPINSDPYRHTPVMQTTADGTGVNESKVKVLSRPKLDDLQDLWLHSNGNQHSPFQVSFRGIRTWVHVRLTCATPVAVRARQPRHSVCFRLRRLSHCQRSSTDQLKQICPSASTSYLDYHSLICLCTILACKRHEQITQA